MITGKENIKQVLSYNNAPYFRISKGENGAIIYQNDLDGTKSIGDGLNDLDQMINILSPGNYHLKYFREKTQGSKFLGVAFAIGSEAGQNQNINGFQPQQPVNNVSEQIEAAIKNYQTNIELETLRKEKTELLKENKELQSKLDNRLAGIMANYSQYLAPHAAKLINGLIPIPQSETTVNGINDDTVNLEEYQKRLEKAFEAWDETNATQLTIIEGIVNLQNINPTMYATAKQFILNS
jgi:hypothetical protein